MFPEQKLCSLDSGGSIREERGDEVTGLVSGDKLRAVGRAAVFGTYRLDFVTAQAFGNVELEELLGVPEVTGVALDKDGCPPWVHPDDRARLIKARQEACGAQGHGRLEQEYRICRSDGSVCWVLDCGQAMLGPDSRERQVIGMSGILLDIDDKKKVELALREKDERLMMALSAAGAGTFRWNVVTDEVELDPALARLVGLPPSRLTMPLHGLAERMHPDDRPGFIAQCWQAVENRACFKTEFRVVLPDGSIRWLMDNGQLSMDSQGQPVFLTGACVDITSRKQTEDQLRTSEARLRSALAVGQMGTWELFLDRGEIAASEGADQLCGLEHRGTRPLADYLKLVHPDDMPLVEGVIQNPPSQFRIEVRVRPHNSERTIWVALQGERRQDGFGRETILTGAVSDISSLKQTESLLQKQALELESRVRELNCLYSVSRLVQQQGDLGRLLQQVVDMIPAGFSRPDNICVRLRWEGGVHQSAAFVESSLRLIQELKAEGRVVGTIEIHRTLSSGMESFAYAEQTLVQALTKPISRAIERKHVLQALSESEDRWRTMTSALAEGVVLYDGQGRIQAWNLSAERLLGIRVVKDTPTGLLKGRTIREDGTPFPVSDYPTLVTLNTGVPCDDIVIGVMRDNGLVSWLSVNTRPLFHAGEKKPYGVVASFADITERKLTEETIRREIEAKELERSRLNTVLQALPVAVYIADADGRLLQVNAAVEEMWGQGILSSSPERYHEDYKAWWASTGLPVQAHEWGLARSVEKGEAIFAEELEIERTDGTRRTILNYSLPFHDQEGGIAGGVGVSVDISDRKRGEAERALLAAVVKASPDAIVSTDMEGRITSWNSGAERMYGYRPGEILGESISILMPENRRDELDLILVAIAKGEGVTYFDSVRLHKDGTPVDVSVAVTPITDASGKVIGASKIDRDISERKRGEAERALLAAVVKASPDGIVSTDMQGRITSWNSGAERMYGYRAGEIIGKSISVLMPADRQDELDLILGAIAKGEGVTYFDSVRLHKDGTPVDVSVAITPITDAAGKVIGASKIDRDISERKRMEEQLHHDAFHDRLTGVANRSLFMDRLEHVVARAERFGERFAVFVMDMDNFKLINDSFGHLVGDQLLCAFVDRVQELLRPVDTLSRFGGDEFTLLLEEVEGLDAVEQIAARVLDALQKPFLLAGQEVNVSSSIGIMLGDRSCKDPDQALRDADVALYEAKRQGKNQYVVFDARMRGEEVSRLYLESELRRALQEVDLTVQYQPIVDLETGMPVGCEALVRWKHPVMGRVDPSRFINVAEETGLITPLGRFVFDKACASLADWLACPGFPADFYISVNMSPKEFYSRDLLPFIESTLSLYQLKGSNIRLEITENVIIQHDREAAAILRRLKEIGICSSLDDFGTGYSSLSYLHQLPFDVIKVDRSFIRRLSEKKQSREIVRSILGLARALDMQTVAEGAETPEQLEQLRSLGFRWVQGYVLYKPLDRTGIRRLFDSSLSA